VDSAEADKVGSREIRFCAYVSDVLDKGVRNRRATPGALISLLNVLLSAVSVIAGSGSYRRAGRYPPAGMSSFRTCGRSAT
jgi:hypothetical protein